MYSPEMLYKITVKHQMGLGTSKIGVKEDSIYYFRDIGDVSFSKRLVNYFEHGHGKYGVDFTIEKVECIGNVINLEEELKQYENNT